MQRFLADWWLPLFVAAAPGYRQETGSLIGAHQFGTGTSNQYKGTSHPPKLLPRCVCPPLSVSNDPIDSILHEVRARRVQCAFPALRWLCGCEGLACTQARDE
eukprot:scaffold589_cov343-Prasinococcus_capsulatus_cf.AAC.7